MGIYGTVRTERQPDCEHVEDHTACPDGYI